MKFEGYDWSELADAFGYPKNLCDADEAIAGYIRGYITDSIYPVSKKTKKIVKTCKKFLALCIKNNNCYNTPLLEGLNKIEDDETFLKYFSVLLEHLWN